MREQFLAEVAKAMELAQARLRKNPRDTAALYAMGISYGLRSNYFLLVEKAWSDSLDDATSARKLHNQVSEIEPGNVDARLVQGLHDYLVGSLPLGWRMLGFLVGFHGDKAKGIRTMQDVAAHGVSIAWMRRSSCVRSTGGRREPREACRCSRICSGGSRAITCCASSRRRCIGWR